ncbi:MAG: DUF3857 domain-containing protein [candidate division Zixibacteria bacterium]|nr:DUF3857 domain-containing protein [candidate division Zixibacteria bacterium]
MKYPRIALFALVEVVLSLTSFLPLSARAHAWEKIDLDQMPTRGMFPYSDAVIIRDEASMAIEPDGEALFTQHRIMKVFSDPGKRYSLQEIPFNSSVEVIKIKARTIHPDGEEFLLDPKDIREKSLLSEYVLYSDAKIKDFYFPRMDTNCVLEYEYQLRFSSLLYWGDWFFESHLPTLFSKYTLIAPKYFDFKVKVLNDKIAPKIEFRKGKKIFTWESTNKRALKKEPFMPPAADTALRLVFSPLQFRFGDTTYSSRNWDDIASWYWQISQPSFIPGQKVQLLASELTAALGSREEKIKAVFEYIQERIRYISVAVGTGAFKPHLCADILEYAYGDCKDMTSLVIALLRAANVEAFPALLSTKGHRSVLNDMPKVKQFDHVVVAVPSEDEYAWLDPACRNCGFGQLPFEDQGATALVMKPTGGELVVTPETSEHENFTHTIWEIKLNSDGSASGKVIIQAGGQEDLSFRASLTESRPQRRRKALSGFLASWLVDPYLVDYEFKNFEEKDSSVLIQASFVSGRFGAEEQGTFYLPVNLNTQSYLNLMFPQEQRDYAVIFDFKFINTDELTLQIPEEFEIDYLPGAVRLDEPFGLFESTCRSEDNRIKYTRVFVRRELYVSADQYPELKEFYDNAAEADNQRIILREKGAQDETE